MVKIRQGRKASTLVTGFEPFFLGADDLAEELRRICASSTSGQLPLVLCPFSDRRADIRDTDSVSDTGKDVGYGGDGAGQADQGRHRSPRRERSTKEVDRER